MGRELLYILGAGASKQALPLAESLSERLLIFADELKTFNPSHNNDELNPRVTDLLWGKIREKFIESLIWLGTESKRHSTVDIYAKKLFIKRDKNNLAKLKSVLSTYLTIEQSITPTDRRYNAFLAKILKSDSNNIVSLPTLPKDLKIITWNYDTQLEKAFYEFCDNDKHVTDSITFNKKQVYRLNGYCGTPNPGHIGKAFRSVWQAKEPESAWLAGLQLFMGYEDNTINNEPDIRFAWESNTINSFANNNSDLEAVEACVVIGYSFPLFNQEIDKNLWLNLSNVRKIYLQYPDGDHASIESRIKNLIHPITEPQIIKIPSSDKEFHLPEEFWNL